MPSPSNLHVKWSPRDPTPFKTNRLMEESIVSQMLYENHTCCITYVGIEESTDCAKVNLPTWLSSLPFQEESTRSWILSTTNWKSARVTRELKIGNPRYRPISGENRTAMICSIWSLNLGVRFHGTITRDLPSLTRNPDAPQNIAITPFAT